MNSLPDRHLLVPATVATPPSVLSFALYTSLKDVRESVCRIATYLLLIDGRIYQLIHKSVARSHNFISAEHTANRLSCCGCEHLIEVFRIGEHQSVVVRHLIQKESIDGLDST